MTPGLGRSPGKGNRSPLQYSRLENPMDRGAWQAAVHGVARVSLDLATKPPELLGSQGTSPVSIHHWLRAVPGASAPQLFGLGKESWEFAVKSYQHEQNGGCRGPYGHSTNVFCCSVQSRTTSERGRERQAIFCEGSVKFQPPKGNLSNWEGSTPNSDQ